MDTYPEFNPGKIMSAAEKMSAAADGFKLAPAFVTPDANLLRRGAAVILEEGAGDLLYEKLISLGICDDQIEELIHNGMIKDVLQALAPVEMDEIEARVRDIVRTDPEARNTLEQKIYNTQHEEGLTNND